MLFFLVSFLNIQNQRIHPLRTVLKKLYGQKPSMKLQTTEIKMVYGHNFKYENSKRPLYLYFKFY